MTKIEIKVLDYLQQPQLQLNQLLDGVASIVNRQKEGVILSVNEMVSTKLQKFEAGIKESHQDLAESASGEIVDPCNFEKTEMSNTFNSIKRQEP